MDDDVLVYQHIHIHAHTCAHTSIVVHCECFGFGTLVLELFCMGQFKSVKYCRSTI